MGRAQATQRSKLITLLVADTKYPIKGNLREGGFVLGHSLRIQSILAENQGSRRLRQPASHTVSTSRKQRDEQERSAGFPALYLV